MWSENIAPPSADIDGDGRIDGSLYLLEQTADGGYVTGGKLGNASGPYEGYAFWVIKTDSLGKRKWSGTYGIEPDEVYNILTSLHQTRDHGYILGGQTEDKSNFFDHDYFVIKLDKKGKSQWSKQIGGYGDDDNVIVKEIGKDRYLVGGNSGADIGKDKAVPICENDSLPYWEVTDYWLVELAYTNPDSLSTRSVGKKIAVHDLSNSQFSIYPNPVKNVLHVQVKGTATLSLTDIAGKILLTKTVTNSGSINLSGLRAGMYYLQNRSTGETQEVIVTGK